MFSRRMDGDMRGDKARNDFLLGSHINPATLVRPQQVHGSSVFIVTDNTKSLIPDCDALVTSVKGITLGVLSADCVPILLHDHVAGVVSAIHAGWKGTMKNIVAEAVHCMMTLGASTSRIEAVIGPHIGVCCYNVPKERASLFPEASTYWLDSWHVDLGYENYRQLIIAGLTKEHIRTKIVCTCCQSDIFYSYRADSQETFGEMIGIVAC